MALTTEQQAVVNEMLANCGKLSPARRRQALLYNTPDRKQVYKELFGYWRYPMAALLWYVQAKLLVIAYMALPML